MRNEAGTEFQQAPEEEKVTGAYSDSFETD
jgi:hypothetical protein